MLTGAFTFAMIAPPGTWPLVVTAMWQGAAVVAALSRAEAGRGFFIAAVAAVAVTVGAAVVAATGVRTFGGLAGLAGAGLLALVPVAIVLEFRRDLTVTRQSVIAAICIYVVLGMFFASLESAVSSLSGLPYFVGRQSADSSDYAYFSFITLATVGYGDLVPAQRLGHALAVLEGVAGQVYLVTVVALVVGNIGRRRVPGPGSER